MIHMDEDFHDLLTKAVVVTRQRLPAQVIGPNPNAAYLSWTMHIPSANTSLRGTKQSRHSGVHLLEIVTLSLEMTRELSQVSGVRVRPNFSLFCNIRDIRTAYVFGTAWTHYINALLCTRRNHTKRILFSWLSRCWDKHYLSCQRWFMDGGLQPVGVTTLTYC